MGRCSNSCENSQRRERVREERASRKEIRDGKRQRRESKKKEDPSARKGRNVAEHCVLDMFCGSGESKSRLAKAVVTEPFGRKVWSSFGSRKSAHGCGAKHIRSENVKTTSGPERFWIKKCAWL